MIINKNDINKYRYPHYFPQFWILFDFNPFVQCHRISFIALQQTARKAIQRSISEAYNRQENKSLTLAFLPLTTADRRPFPASVAPIRSEPWAIGCSGTCPSNLHSFAAPTEIAATTRHSKTKGRNDLIIILLQWLRNQDLFEFSATCCCTFRTSHGLARAYKTTQISHRLHEKKDANAYACFSSSVQSVSPVFSRLLTRSPPLARAS